MKHYRTVENALATALLMLSAAGCGAGTPTPVEHAVATASPIPPDARHLLLVRSADWSATTATLARFSRQPNGAWQPEGEAVSVVLGRSGMGWGRGLHADGAPDGHTGPVKAEGDGRSPAGVFALGDTFGYDATTVSGATALYHELTPSWQCVDDGASDRYNTVFDTAGMETPWTSFETMRREDELYRRVVFVEHNTGPALARGGGSCIFLHVWRGSDSVTSGCTAMELAPLEDIIRFIDPGHTVLVQLPESEVTALQSTWGIPG